jgi:hypothetical protein
MAEESIEPRPLNLRQLFPWTEIFRGFQIALDPKKLLLAAAGILAMALWWWFCSLAFYSPRSKPEWPKDYPLAGFKSDGDDDKSAGEKAWAKFTQDRAKWNLLHEAAGTQPDKKDAGDLAQKLDYFEPINRKIQVEKLDKFSLTFDGTDYSYEVTVKPYGRIALWPWFEERGPNPVLLVVGKAGYTDDRGAIHPVPWEKGQFPSWFLTNQVPVLIEPLIKFMRPVYYMVMSSPVGFLNYFYFTLILLGNLLIWALIGGAITRMAAVQIARKEKIGITEALRFTRARWISFFSAPLFPLVCVLVLVVLTVLFGLFHLIPVIGDILVDGLFWPLILGAGLVMAILLVGLVGWPMMYATISTEGSDSFDALSRSYSYVYQSPWNYVWYVLVSVSYGMVLVFFVGFMGSLTVYLGKWGMSQTPFAKMVDRDPAYLFVYAPTSYQWRDLLLQDSPAEPTSGVLDKDAYTRYVDKLTWYNKAGAFLVAAWLFLVFLLVLGFGYSYFWSAGTIIYLLMRRKVDDTELDEVYVEEEEPEQAYSSPAPEPPAEDQSPAVTMVDSPELRTPDSSPPPSEPLGSVESATHEGPDGSPPAGH